ncbi:MAG: hypothetical protein LBV74_02330 [Tannerella sp.]|jgi:hypothetical protein|nr:hypothetical protein [Tannerella sp.]
MKTVKILNYALAIIIISGFAACSDDNKDPQIEGNDYVFGTDSYGHTTCDHLLFDGNGKEAPEGTAIGNGEQNFAFTGTQTLRKGTYTLKGWIYVASGATLTIEEGTVIKGDKQTQAALIVEPGGKLIAKGTASAPIVFTSNQPKGSRKPGDWGGLIVCGKAPNNQNNDQQIEGGPRTHHGGTNAADNSGILSYVRVEFAGYPFQTDKEINGITFGSVGNGTQVDHIQVSYSNDDSFEWFGGAVNCKYLVAYKGWDDDFDTDNGFSGKVQFGLVVRDPKIADVSQSNGFESDNCADGSTVSPYTTTVFSNITFIGPAGRDNFENTNDYINGGDYNPNNGSALGKFQAAMQIRRSSRLSCFNSIAIGYPIGLILDGEKGNTPSEAKAGNLKLQNIWFAGMDITGSDANKRYTDDLYDAANKVVIDANSPSFSTTFFLSQTGNAVKEISDLNFSDAYNVGVNYMPNAGSPALTAASFSDNLLSSGFDKVNYIGAFNTNDKWLEGWTNFDPNNTDY